MKLGKDLVAASATPLVLSTLELGDSYGYEIIQRIREVSDGELEWKEGMLYPLLHRLERQGLIEGYDAKSESVTTESARRAGVNWQDESETSRLSRRCWRYRYGQAWEPRMPDRERNSDV